MFAIIGIVVVFGAVIGGFLMEKGHMAVLLQPAELLIICRRGDGHAAGGQPDAHYQGSRGRTDGGAEGFAVHQSSAI